jgi:B12-binding domain/radical SAM domain protein
VRLVLADRPGSRCSASVLAGAVEGSALASAVDVRFAAGAAAIAALVVDARDRGAPCVVAWPFLSAQAAAAAADLAAVRAAAPPRPGAAVLHVAGGPHPSAAPREALAAGFDVVVRGEGERALLDLLARVREGDRPPPGVAPRSAPVRLDDHPAFSAQRGRAGPIELTRGCVHACAYCQTPALHGARLRHRSPAAVAEAVRALVARGMTDVRFVTPSALSYGAARTEVRLDAVGALLEAVRAALPPRGRMFLGSFPSELRPEHATPEALALLRRFVANDALLLGAQSGSDRVLAALRRGHTAEDVRAAVRRARDAGFRPEVDFIVGLPGEAPEDAAATRALMAWCAEQGARVHGHAFLPLPGTALARAAAGGPDAETRELLARLEGKGSGYGQWRRQADLDR